MSLLTDRRVTHLSVGRGYGAKFEASITFEGSTTRASGFRSLSIAYRWLGSRIRQMDNARRGYLG